MSKKYRVKAYDQLVRGSALQNIYDMLAPYGYKIDFVYTENLESEHDYHRGLEYALLRDKTLIEEIRNMTFVDVQDRVKNVQERTVIILYNINDFKVSESVSEVVDRSKISMGRRCGNSILVGGGYVKVKNSSPVVEEWKPGTILPLEEVIKGAIEVTEIDPVSDYVIKGEEVTLKRKPSKFAIPVKAYKDRTFVDFSVEMSLITPSEKVAKELNFILLSSLCGMANNKTGYIEYEFMRDQKFAQVYKYDRLDTTNIKTLGAGGSKHGRLYTIATNYNIKQASLFSEFTKYEQIGFVGDAEIEVVLKLGVYQNS